MSEKVIPERSYRATLDEVWELWTSKEGIEAWWGPEGFKVEVQSLEVKTGGHMQWSMIADAPEMVEAMKQMGQKVRTEHRNTFSEVKPKTLLVWSAPADFIPGVKSYPMNDRAEFSVEGGQVTVRVVLQRMHDEMWTSRKKMGWEMQLAKLERELNARSKS